MKTGPMDTQPQDRLTRVRENRLIAGVMAGIARRFGWDVGRVRLAYVLLSVLSAGFPGTLVYIALWLLMPEEAHRQRQFKVRPPGGE